MLSVFLQSVDYPDILCFTETWLTDNETAIVTLENYNLAVSHLLAHLMVTDLLQQTGTTILQIW